MFFNTKLFSHTWPQSCQEYHNGGSWANDDDPLGLTEPEIFIFGNLDTREYKSPHFIEFYDSLQTQGTNFPKGQNDERLSINSVANTADHDTLLSLSKSPLELSENNSCLLSRQCKRTAKAKKSSLGSRPWHEPPYHPRVLFWPKMSPKTPSRNFVNWEHKRMKTSRNGARLTRSCSSGGYPNPIV